MKLGQEDDKKIKEDDTMSTYVKPIQATPTLSGNDAVCVIKQALKVPSQEAVERNKRMLEIRKRHEKK